jgi:hypothetical protein
LTDAMILEHRSLSAWCTGNTSQSILELCRNGWQSIAQVQQISFEALVTAGFGHFHGLSPDVFGLLRNFLIHA